MSNNTLPCAALNLGATTVSSNPGVELKGGMYTFMSLKLHTADMEVIDAKLADKVQQAPSFFKDTPVVIDLTVLEKDENEIKRNKNDEKIRLRRSGTRKMGIPHT